MLRFLEDTVNGIIKLFYSRVSRNFRIWKLKKYGLDEYARNIYNELNDIHVHRSNCVKKLEDIYIISNVTDEIISKIYIYDSANIGVNIEIIPTSVLERNPKASVKKKMIAEKGAELMTKDEIINGFNKVLILGQPGLGKTTLLRSIAIDYCKNRNQNFVPVYLPLRSIFLLENSLLNFVNNVFEENGISNPENLVLDLLKNGKLIILLDGLDEVDSNIKERIIEEILSLSNKYNKNTFFVSTRISDYHGELSEFKELELMEFSRENSIEFVNKWFSDKDDAEKRKMLVYYLNEFPQIAEIANNPLLLSLICNVFEFDLEIPSRRTTLYKRCLECLLREWDAQRNFRRISEYSKLDESKKIYLLGELAYALHLERKVFFTIKDITSILGRTIEDYGVDVTLLPNVIDEIMSHVGILVEVSRDIYSFSHLTFQEYFVANYISSNKLYFDIFDNYYDNKFWEEVLVLCAALIPNSTEYIECIYNKQDSTKQNLVLSGLCLAVDPVIDKLLKEKIVNSLLSEYHNCKSKSLRNNCLLAIIRIDDTFVGKKLIKSMGVDKSFFKNARSN